MNYPFLFALLLIVNLGCSQVKSKPITEVSQDELKNVVLVDVRTPEEFAAGHLPEATNINWNDPDFAEQMSAIDKDQTIYVYCQKGGRSAKAQAKLEVLGYGHVVDLVGGYEAWSKANP